MSKVSESVSEKPLLCNAEMVRAILDGIKTNTRRPMEPQPDDKLEVLEGCDDFMLGGTHSKKRSVWRCPFGKKGDRLWVRETWAPISTFDPSPETGAIYRADNHPSQKAIPVKWTPSIHMPRWASRINLEITDVRVERVQEISEEDAIAEGTDFGVDAFGKRFVPPIDKTGLSTHKPCKESFKALWESIYGKSSWRLNPWVWVVAFKKV